MSDARPPRQPGCRGFVRALDPAVATAFGCIMLLLLLGSLYSTSFLSPEYLLQQLKVASFLGVIATGMMLVILLGQIDLSVPWVVAVGGMMASAAAAYGTGGMILAIPFGIFCGVADRPRQRHRRRLSAHPLDDRHARHQRRRARADGGLHRRLLAAGFGVRGDALPGDRLPPARRAERGGRLGAARRGDRVPAHPHDLRPRRLRHRQPRARGLSSPASTRGAS